MGMLMSAYLMPHPPLAVPEVGRGSEGGIAQSIASYEQIASEIASQNPDTIIVISPHAPVVRGFHKLHVFRQDTLSGDFGNFRAAGVKLAFENDCELVGRIAEEAKKIDVTICGEQGREMRGLDHGTMVPLYYIQKQFVPFKIVVISVAPFPTGLFFRFGGRIADAVKASDRKVVLVASGDLSHKLTEDGPYGYDPSGPEFDRYILDCIARNDVQSILETKESLLEHAAQCGFYGIAMLYGAMCNENENNGLASKVYSYEGPFGVGYGFAKVWQKKAADTNMNDVETG